MDILVMELDLIEDQVFHFRMVDWPNCIIFEADMNSSAHIDNKKKVIFVLGKGPTQGLEHTLTAEKMYLINFTVTKKKFCLNLHYNRENNYFFVHGREIINLRQKILNL